MCIYLYVYIIDYVYNTEKAETLPLSLGIMHDKNWGHRSGRASEQVCAPTRCEQVMCDGSAILNTTLRWFVGWREERIDGEENKLEPFAETREWWEGSELELITINEKEEM